jgi:hyperosmotically inducible periplasmic protein
MLRTKIFIAILGTFAIAMTGCQVAKTNSDAPDTTTGNVQTPTTESAKSADDDASSAVRRKQLESDIRAREQRNNALNNGQANNRSTNDLASEVRAKLEANLPASALAVSASEGAVTITGTVPTQAQYDRINGLAKEIKGVTSVAMKVAVAPASPTASPKN